jgi:hypothetical protein
VAPSGSKDYLKYIYLSLSLSLHLYVSICLSLPFLCLSISLSLSGFPLWQHACVWEVNLHFSEARAQRSAQAYLSVPGGPGTPRSHSLMAVQARRGVKGSRSAKVLKTWRTDKTQTKDKPHKPVAVCYARQSSGSSWTHGKKRQMEASLVALKKYQKANSTRMPVKKV